MTDPGTHTTAPRSTMARIKDSEEADLDAIAALHRAAFGDDEGPEVADLVRHLFSDDTARPMLSLVAEVDSCIVGHVLFTAVRIPGADPPVEARILAPLAARPAHQDRGIGGMLVRAGLDRLSQAGVGLVFVLGHPGYYPRFGFQAASGLGLMAPYPIPDARRAGWMVRASRPGLLGRVRGTVACARSLSRPEYW